MAKPPQRPRMSQEPMMPGGRYGSHGKNLGKPWENMGKHNKSWKKLWTRDLSHGKIEKQWFGGAIWSY